MTKKAPHRDAVLTARLLIGTSAAVLALVPAPAMAQIALPPVQVTGAQGGDYSATTPDLVKLQEPLLDTPISVTTITQQLMQDQGVTNLNDAFRNVPSVTMEAGEVSWQGNAPYIRGFNARTDMFLDGLRDIGFYYRDPWDLEDIQVLQGPDGILFGRGSTGGAIEQTTKTPQLDAFAAARISAGTNNLERATVDVNEPIGGLGMPAAFRINAMGDSEGVPGRDVVKYGRYGFAPSLELGLGTPTRMLVNYFHQAENDIPDYGQPWYFGKPAPVDRDNFYGYRSDHFNATADIGTVEIAHDFSSDLTVQNQFRYADYGREETGSKPAMPASATPTTPLNTITVTINSFSEHSTEKELQDQLNTVAKFDTGPIRHDLTTGFEYDWE